MSIEKSAGAVIFRKEPSFAKAMKGKKNTIKYLLLHYELGHWDLPKGHIEKGETPEEAAMREIKEETNIEDVKFLPGFKETIKYFYKRDGQNFFKTVVFFLAKTKTKKIKISYEHRGSRWLPYEKALKQITFNNAKTILKKADKFLDLKKKA